MFYLALLLVLVGLLIFLVALFSEKSNIDTSNEYAKAELFSNKYKKSPEFKEEDIIFPEISDDFTETQLRDNEEDVFVSLSSDLPSEMSYEEDLTLMIKPGLRQFRKRSLYLIVDHWGMNLLSQRLLLMREMIEFMQFYMMIKQEV